MAKFGVKPVAKMTEKEYRALPEQSASSFRLFVTDRKKYYKEQVLGEARREGYNRAMTIGNLVHCYLLEPQHFDDRFIISTIKAAPTNKMLAFVEALANFRLAYTNEDGELTVEFSEIAETAYEIADFKWTIERVMKEFEKPHKTTGEKPSAYFEEIIDAAFNKKQLCTLDDVAIAEKIVSIVKEDRFVGFLFNNPELIEDNDIEIFYEQKIDGFTIDGIPIKCMMDMIYVDHTKKTMTIFDPKNVFDNQNFRGQYYLKKRADIQGYIYYQGLMSHRLELGFDYSKYTINPPVFVAIDSGCFYAPLMYVMSYEDLNKAYFGFDDNGRRYPGMKEIIRDIKFAQENNLWNITEYNYNNKGIVRLNVLDVETS